MSCRHSCYHTSTLVRLHRNPKIIFPSAFAPPLLCKTIKWRQVKTCQMAYGKFRKAARLLRGSCAGITIQSARQWSVVILCVAAAICRHQHSHRVAKSKLFTAATWRSSPKNVFDRLPRRGVPCFVFEKVIEIPWAYSDSSSKPHGDREKK